MKRKKNKGFTLIECIVALGLVSILAAVLLPSLNYIAKANNKLQTDTRLIYALESAIEKNKTEGIGDFTENINGFEIKVSISRYDDNLKKIRASYENYSLDLVR